MQPPTPVAKNSDNPRTMLANMTPEEQRQMGGYSGVNTYDPYPWNAQTGFSPEAWARLSRKERQHFYGLHLIPLYVYSCYFFRKCSLLVFSIIYLKSYVKLVREPYPHVKIVGCSLWRQMYSLWFMVVMLILMLIGFFSMPTYDKSQAGDKSVS